MPKAVQFDEYGGIDVLKIVEVPMPRPSHNEIVVRVKAAGINSGEAMIRQGLLHSRFPATFPSGEGTDFAGVVDQRGPGVTKFKTGDEVVGHTDKRASHAEYVVVSEDDLVVKPESVSWEAVGSLWVAGTTAYAGVQAVTIKPGDKVVVTGAAGGVGSIAIQLAKLAGADVYGITGEYDGDWLESLRVTPIDYRDEVTARIGSLVGLPDAMIDTVDKGYVKLAIELGVKPDRINTLVDYAAVEKYGVKSNGSAAAANDKVLEQLLSIIAEGAITIPIARTFPLDDVREAFEFLAGQHHRGKVVLLP